MPQGIASLFYCALFVPLFYMMKEKMATFWLRENYEFFVGDFLF
jgi:hypothetical protein